MRNIYQSLTPLSKIGAVILVILLSVVVTTLLSAVLAIPFFGIESFVSLTSSSLVFDKENLSLLKYFQIAQSIGLFIIPSILLAYFFGGHVTAYLAVNKKPYWQSVVYSILLVIAMGPVINIVGYWNSQLILPDWLSNVENWMIKSEADAKLLTELFLKTDNNFGLLVNVLMIGIIPAIGEEFLFRGVIQKVFQQWTKNAHWAIWITAILFSALHMQFYGFVPRVLLGAMFGYLFIWSGNLWLPILAHFFNNTAAVIAYHFYNKGLITVDPESIGTDSENWPFVLASMMLVLFLFYKLKQFEFLRKLERE